MRENRAMEPSIRVRVRLFAMQREVAGTRELSLEVRSPATVDDAWSAAVARVPALAAGRASLRFAVNGAYADPAAPLSDGDEVACIPPVSGGADRPRCRGRRASPRARDPRGAAPR